MAVPFDDAAFVLEPDEEVLIHVLQAVRPKSGTNWYWTPKILSEDSVSEEFLKNQFFVDVKFENPKGGASIDLSLPVSGATKVEHVCTSSFSRLRSIGRIGYEPLCCVFRTVEESPLLIPCGSFLGELYDNYPTANGSGALLSASVVSQRFEGRSRYIISPGEEFILGHWMTGLLIQ